MGVVKGLTKPSDRLVSKVRKGLTDSVEIGDLKLIDFVYEDNGRKPWENRRQDPPGSISGWHLGNAANRLVANSFD
ncbi:5'-3' exoribonuclease 3 [Camellia lanceoleosa]|uniref:5'-3' exoribonuclease 3 n=1 Tax=Camellia lanceoleosa TaxID=1840588 RepID=A0ACC0FW57_9ERIC|nr:5'-3' exoribonuclease 3 [Camellia lanceoleosa]